MRRGHRRWQREGVFLSLLLAAESGRYGEAARTEAFVSAAVSASARGNRAGPSEAAATSARVAHAPRGRKRGRAKCAITGTASSALRAAALGDVLTGQAEGAGSAGEELPVGSLRLVTTDDEVQLQAAKYMYSVERRQRPGQGAAEGETEQQHVTQTEVSKQRIDLLSSLHVGDAAFFDRITRDSFRYDYFLYELITSKKNIKQDAWGRRKVAEQLLPTEELSQMASTYGMQTQLGCIDYTAHDHWYLADIPKETIQGMQAQLGESVLGATPPWVGQIREVMQALTTGRAKEQQAVLPSPFLQGVLRGPILLLRALLWAVPCPELNMILLDWSRASPRAGGLSSLLSRVLECLLRGDVGTARRLCFAQQLVSNQREGGQASVLISARNYKAIDAITAALKESVNTAAGGGGMAADVGSAVGVLYGACHMPSMRRELERRLGAEEGSTITLQGVEWMPVWRIPLPSYSLAAAVGDITAGPRDGEKEASASALASATSSSSSSSSSSSNNNSTMIGQKGASTVLALTGGALLYLTLGAWDWADLLRTLGQGLEGGGGVVGDGEAALAVALYALRHGVLYNVWARYGVSWDRRLF